MPSLLQENPHYIDLTSSSPLVGGKVFIGTKGSNPSLGYPDTTDNLITIYSDRALTIPLANPQTIGSNGRTANKIWIPEQYALEVWDANGVQKLLDQDAGGAVNESANINYLPAGEGAVSRTVQSKLRESVSVFDFMTAAEIADVQSGALLLDVIDAFNSAGSAGSVVYIPTGTYRTSTPPDGTNTVYIFARDAKVVPDTGNFTPRAYRMEGNTEYYKRKTNPTAGNPTQPRIELLLTSGVSVSAGETVTQATSGATGVVAYEGYHNTPLSVLHVYSVTGTFNTANELTGSVSGALGAGSVPLVVTKGAYQNLAESYGDHLFWVNGYGYQEVDTDGFYNGSAPVGKIPAGQTRLARTGSYQLNLQGSHSGQGDGYNLFLTMAATEHGLGTTVSWSGNNSTGLIGGQVNALTDNVTLYGMGDVVLNDKSKDNIPLLGNVSILYYDGTETGGYNIPRFNYLSLSNGANDVDAAYIAQGNYEVGLDLSGGVFNTNSAITLAQDHRISYDATPPATVGGKFSTQAVGTTWSAFDGTYLNFTIGNVTLMRGSSSRLELRPAINATDTMRIYGTTDAATDTDFLGFGQVAASSYISAFSGADANTTKLHFQTANAGTEAIAVTIEGDKTVDFKKAGTAASVPGNFSAGNYMTMKVNGTTVYIPYSTSTW